MKATVLNVVGFILAICGTFMGIHEIIEPLTRGVEPVPKLNPTVCALFALAVAAYIFADKAEGIRKKKRGATRNTNKRQAH